MTFGIPFLVLFLYVEYDEEQKQVHFLFLRGRRREAAARRLGLALELLEKRPHLSRTSMTEECSARSAISAGVQNKDARGSKEGGSHDGLENEVAGNGDGENPLLDGTYWGRRRKGRGGFLI